MPRTTSLNNFQLYMLTLIKAAEHHAQWIQKEASIAPTGWTAQCLRDFATVGFLMPQRSGKAVFPALAANAQDLLVFSTAEQRNEFVTLYSYFTPDQLTVGFKDLPPIKPGSRVWISDPFWHQMLKGQIGENPGNIDFFEKISTAASGHRICIILVDSPF